MVNLASASLTSVPQAMKVTIKTPAEQEQMRVAGRLAADVLDMIGPRRARRDDRGAQCPLPRLHRERAEGRARAA